MSVHADGLLSWHRFADALKRSDWPLRMADRLGRNRVRLRPLAGWWPTPKPPCVPDLRAFAAADFAACWLGHATMLYRIGGRTVLTDPVFSSRVGLGIGPVIVGPRRLQRPAIPLRKLPPIDLLLLTHAHFDHLDRATLHRLPKDCEVVCAPGTSDLVDDLGFRKVTELPAGGRMSAAKIDVAAVATTHWGPRVFIDNWRGYVGFVLESGDRRILHTGDTADTHAFDGTGPFDLGAFGIGAYDPYVAAHATPEQAWRMCNAAGCERMAAYHHTTFRLSREPADEPLRRLLAAAGDKADRVVVSEVGEMWVDR